MSRIPLLVILGPTASGKTALSLRLAHALNGEIISADSRQIYKEIDIGSDKIPMEKREGIPHHLIDFVEPDQVYTMSEFKRDADQLIREIHARGHMPMLVGGTGLYIRAIVENFELPDVPPQPELRAKYNAIIREYGLEKGKEELYKMLIELDPTTAEKIHRNNLPYVMRALEIAETVGKKVEGRSESPYDVTMIGIKWPREQLWSRIDERVDLQMQRGLLDEAKMLLEKYSTKLPSMTSLGAKEFEDYFAGRSTLEEVVQKLKFSTRQYAKRQQTWFKKDKDILWITGEDLGSDSVVESILKDIKARSS